MLTESLAAFISQAPEAPEAPEAPGVCLRFSVADS
jgi:hypothetical protein